MQYRLRKKFYMCLQITKNLAFASLLSKIVIYLQNKIDWYFREGCSSPRTRTRTLSTRSATSARCCRSRSTPAFSPQSPSQKQLVWELSTTWRDPTTLQDLPSTFNPAFFSQTQTQNEKLGFFWSKYPFSSLWFGPATWNALFKRQKLLKLCSGPEELIPTLMICKRTLLG